MNPVRWLLPILLTVGAAASAQAAPNCALANVVESAAYDPLTIGQWSEAD